MKSILTALLLASFLASSGYEAAIGYFSRERSVTISSPDRQNYLIVDADFWKYARPDLADLRLYEGLVLDAKNFIDRAQLQGRKAPNDRSGPDLGSTTLYDFTAEGLGSNSALKFPTSSFPYLHVRLAPGISPNQIKGAFVSNVAETKAAWMA